MDVEVVRIAKAIINLVASQIDELVKQVAGPTAIYDVAGIASGVEVGIAIILVLALEGAFNRFSPSNIISW